MTVARTGHLHACAHCGVEFRTWDKASKGVYCSRECHQVGQANARPRIVLHFSCAQCGRGFKADYQRTFCSRRCFGAWQSVNHADRVAPSLKLDMEVESRGACLKLPGACRFTSCRNHLASPDGGTMRVRRLPQLPEHMCAVKEASEARTLEHIAGILGCTRERARQIEERALMKLKKHGVELEGA